MGADGVAGLSGGAGEAIGAPVPMGENSVRGLGAARVDAADDLVAVSAERARQGERRRPELIRDCVSVSLDRLDRPGAAAADAADHLVCVSADGASRELR